MAYREALRLGPGNSEALNSLAWILATNRGAEIRDGKEAVDLAERACQGLSQGQDRPGRLDTLAAAYAEAGRYPEAVATAHQAVELAGNAGDERLAKDIAERLALYESGRPFRQAAP
jgi:cytochrome c-type biogenesis protein CcmH/NrfG